MKSKLLILFLITSSLSHLNSQNIETNKNVFIQSGMVNSIAGYNFTVGFEKLFGNDKHNGFDAAFNFQSVDESFAVMIINEKSYFFNIAYKRYFEIQFLNHFLPYGSIGMLSGLTHIDKNNNGIYHINEQNKFLYGVISSVGIEYDINKISPYLEGSYYYTEGHYFRINIGLKYHF